MNYVWILSCDLSIIWMHRYAELVYIWIFWVVDSECWLWIWMCPVNQSLIWMFTFSVVLVCELVSMPTVGYVTCGCQRHTLFPRRIASCMVQRLVKRHYREPSTEEKNRLWCASSVVPPAPSLIQFARGSGIIFFQKANKYQLGLGFLIKRRSLFYLSIYKNNNAVSNLCFPF